MDRASKIFYIVLGIIILLVVIFFISVYVIVHRVDWRSAIQKQVKKQTGRDLVLKGKLNLGVFPSIKIETNNASLGNPPGFPTTPFMSIKKVDISVETWPLLTGRIKVKSFTIDGAAIHLIQNKQGQGNWNFSSGQGSKVKITAAQKATIKAKATKVIQTSKQNQAVLLNIPKLDIKNASLTWSNLKTGQKFLLTNLNLTASNVRQANRFPVNLTFNVNNSKPQISGNVKLSAKVLMINDELDLTPLTASLNLKGSALPQQKLDGNFDANFAIVAPHSGGMNLQLSSGSFNLNQLKLTNLNSHITLNNNQLSINPLTANLYGGTMDERSTLDLNKLTYRSQLSMKNVQLGTALEAFNHKNFFGTMLLNLALTGSLNNQVGSLNGHGSFNVANGQYQGVDIAYLYRVAANTIKPGSIGSLPNSRVTKFGHATADFTINKGVLASNNLLILSPVLRIQGTGNANLLTQTLDWKVQVTGMQGSANKPRPLGPTIPFIIGGTFANVNVKPDLQALLQSTAKQKLQGVVNKGLKNLNLGKLFR